MGRKIKLSDGSTVRYPNQISMNEVVNQLLSNDQIGSSVLEKNASVTDKIKYELCEKILKYKLRKGLSQKELAKKIGIDEPEVSRILHYKFERYSIERLLSFATILYPKLKLEIKAA